MDLSIIILNYKTRGLVRQCLKHLVAARLTISHEIIVVDNASDDGVFEMLRTEFPFVKPVALPQNYGYAGGNNAGIKKSEGKYLMILNPDILLLDNGIEKMVAHLETQPNIAILGPKLLNPDRSPQYSSFRFYKWYTPILRRTPFGQSAFGEEELGAFLMKDANREVIHDVDWLLGGALLVRREAIASFGLLDTRYFMYFDDVDWCRAAWEAGYRVTYFPETTMIHFHLRESADTQWYLAPFNAMARTHIRSAIKYFWKWKGIRINNNQETNTKQTPNSNHVDV